MALYALMDCACPLLFFFLVYVTWRNEDYFLLPDLYKSLI